VECKTLACILLFLLASSTASAHQVQIGVLGLFHPREITLSAANTEALVVTAGESEFVFEPGRRAELARIAVSQGGLVLEFSGHSVYAAEIRATGRDRGSSSFFLGVPGKIRRKYQGTLAVKVIDGEVAPVVTMDLETAVASVVAAESEQATPLEALKAQAIVTRSYFLASKGRHRDFDFCDATHCQFLREPPVPGSPPAVATLATRGLVILFDQKPVAAMFTRSCGGHTQTPAQLGISSVSYPYYSVLCDACYRSPVRWTRGISEQDAARLIGKGEAGRLAVDRRLGWNAVPSNTFEIKREDHEVILEGKGQGHGIGLCQRGARSMAEGGADFRDILNHYFPNTTLGMSSQGSAAPNALVSDIESKQSRSSSL
jgi:peptidoglycan hydrolase-like amidase